MSTVTEDRTRYCSRCLTTFLGDADVCPNLACRCKRRKDGWGELLQPGDVLDRHYRIERSIAIGGAGVTYLGQALGDDDLPVGPKLAIKVLFTHRDHGPFLRRLSTEAQILQELDHPNIVRTMGFVSRAGSSPYLITRFEGGGSLLDHLRRVGAMPVSTVAAMGVQLLDALGEAHNKGVIHRDLKPENILLSAVAGPREVPLVRITDFGIAKVFGGVGDRLTRVGAFVGTPQYAAPEQFEGLTPSPATDLYGAAAVLLFCCTLKPLLSADLILDPVELREALVALLPPRLEAGEDAARLAAFNHFLAATMAAEPGDRVSVGRARAMLQGIVDGVYLLDPLPGSGPQAASVHEPMDAVDGPPSETFLFNPDTAELIGADGVVGPAEGAPGDDAPTVPAPPPPPDVATRPAQEVPVEARRPAVYGDTAVPLSSLSNGITDVAASPAEDTTVSMTPPPPPVLDDEPAPAPVSAPAPAPASDDEPLPRFRPMLWPWALAAMVLGGLGLGLVGWTWYSTPWRLPAELTDAVLPPVTLRPAKAEHAADYDAILAGFTPKVAELRSACRVTPDQQVVLDLVIEPTGRLRRIAVNVGDIEQARCLSRNLKDVRFDRVGYEAVRVALKVGG